MKKQTFFSLLISFPLAFSAQTVFADDIPATPMQMSSILQNLQTKGYINVEKIKFEDNEYEAQVITSQGRSIKLHINPQTGEIINPPKPTQSAMTALEVTKKVEAAGYHNIYKLELEDADEYEVKAINKEGKKVKLEIDASNGKISEKWFD